MTLLLAFVIFNQSTFNPLVLNNCVHVVVFSSSVTDIARGRSEIIDRKLASIFYELVFAFYTALYIHTYSEKILKSEKGKHSM